MQRVPENSTYHTHEYLSSLIRVQSRPSRGCDIIEDDDIQSAYPAEAGVIRDEGDRAEIQGGRGMDRVGCLEAEKQRGVGPPTPEL